jgi:16S rRNA processing protein RimM
MLLTVGRIIRAHGIRGEVLVDVRTDEPAERFAVGSVLVTDSTAVRRLAPVPAGAWSVPAQLTVESVRPHQSRLLVVFDGVYDRTLAEDLRGVLLCVDSAEVKSSDDPDEFNDHELVGLAAVDAAGQPLGEVVRVDHAPASDLLVVRRPDGRTALVPFVKAIVPEVDLAAGRVVLTPPEGLLDL